MNVPVKETKNGVSTGGDGNYSNKVQKRDVLEFSFIGFDTKDVKVSGPEINIVLSKSSQSLKEVVIISALGIILNKSSLGYSA